METISKTEIQCPIAVKWTIPENRLKEIKNQNDEYLRSEIFQASNIPGVKYYILIYPNGNKDIKNLGKTMVFLYHHQSIVSDLTFEEKMKLLQFFDKYDIQQFKADLENHLIDEIDPSNICHLANCSFLSNARKLEKMCFDKLLIYSKIAEPIMDFDALDGDFALNLLKNTFIKVSK